MVGAVGTRVNALAGVMDTLLDDVSVRRRELHRALAWYPTWSAMAPLCDGTVDGNRAMQEEATGFGDDRAVDANLGGRHRQTVERTGEHWIPQCL